MDRTARRALPLALALLLLAAAPASASHRWSRYHWARASTAAPVPLTIDDTAVTGAWGVQSGAVVSDWNAFSGGVLTLTAGASGVDVTASSGDFGASGWLGIAEIQVDVKRHITTARVRLNDYYYGPGSAYAGSERTVYCQEVGHTFGLDHNRNGKRGGTPDDTCMNDGTLAYRSPNAHDAQMLQKIYDHGDGYSTADRTRASSSGWIVVDRVSALAFR